MAIRGRYPNIFKKGSADIARASKESGIDTFRVRGLIYEVALTGISGVIKEVEKLSIWEFFDILSFLRAQTDFRNGLSR